MAFQARLQVELTTRQDKLAVSKEDA
jgi:hypothetical protein